MSGQNKIWLEYCNAVAFFKKNITTDFFLDVCMYNYI